MLYKLVQKNMGKTDRVTDSVTVLLEQFLILITCAGDSLTGNLLCVGSGTRFLHLRHPALVDQNGEVKKTAHGLYLLLSFKDQSFV